MSGVPPKDWIQTGWRIWYYLDGQVQVFSSEDTKWESLPPEGVQCMVRFYNDSDGKPTSEMIMWCDLYTESWDSLRSLINKHPELKIDCELTHAEVAHLLQECRDDQKYAAIDDSMEKYSRQTKTVVGWTCYVLDNDGIVAYDSNNFKWDDVPGKDVLLLARNMSDGTTKWVEQIYNVDCYVLDSEMERFICSKEPLIKRGAIMDENELELLIQSIDKEISGGN